MSKAMQISLKPGERIYVNGAVIRVDRKVTIVLENDASFLLESHILQPEETSTPLRQLYFVLQSVLIDPPNAERARSLFTKMFVSTLDSFSNRTVIDGLHEVANLVSVNRIFEALRAIRALFAVEDAIINPPGAAPQAA
ncbi:MAG TPA: flagellar biosynthesis repressor FlbT [Bauldia sp.]|nr:flagellar biosynthesis repressor FlbT [Bauldia sp.]